MVDLNKGMINAAIPGEYEFRVTWRVEKGGRFFNRKSVDLDAMGLVADEDLHWIGAVHEKDPRPFGGLLRHPGNTKAKSGGEAHESIFFDLAGLTDDPDARHAVFAVTCFSNSLALGELAELRFDLFAPGGGEQSILRRGRRSIKEAASAALAVRVDIAKGEFVEIDDHYNITPVEGATKWRQLADASTDVLSRVA